MSCQDADTAAFDKHVDALAAAVEKAVDKDEIMAKMEEYRRRMGICRACPFRRGKGCANPAMGCALAVKARLSWAKCPEGYW